MLFVLLELISACCLLEWKGTWWCSLEKILATAAAAAIKPFISQPSSLGWGVAWPGQVWAQASGDPALAPSTLLESLTTRMNQPGWGWVSSSHPMVQTWPSHTSRPQLPPLADHRHMGKPSEGQQSPVATGKTTQKCPVPRAKPQN